MDIALWSAKASLTRAIMSNRCKNTVCGKPVPPHLTFCSRLCRHSYHWPSKQQDDYLALENQKSVGLNLPSGVESVIDKDSRGRSLYEKTCQYDCCGRVYIGLKTSQYCHSVCQHRAMLGYDTPAHRECKNETCSNEIPFHDDLRKKYCTEQCGTEQRNRSRRMYPRLGRKRKPRIVKYCKNCGEVFKGQKNSRFCKRSCYRKYYDRTVGWPLFATNKGAKNYYAKYREALGRLLKQQNYTCGICRRALQLLPLDEIHVDHILPKSKGGTNEYTNLQATHKLCNLRKGNRV